MVQCSVVASENVLADDKGRPAASSPRTSEPAARESEPAARVWSTAELLAARAVHVGANVALNYRLAPLHLVRGRAQYLYDAEGLEYLDCVNNVCHVGHCQPEVAFAASAQLLTLNTNARYLSAHALEYSQRLTATLPPPLRVVYFTNSGSEANDLALRLARAHTKRRGLLCVGGAYHGHVTAMVDASPYKFERESGGQRCVQLGAASAEQRADSCMLLQGRGCGRRRFRTCTPGCTAAM
jgi:4-aminobutyrate aminotransferase-like enzyme